MRQSIATRIIRNTSSGADDVTLLVRDFGLGTMYRRSRGVVLRRRRHLHVWSITVNVWHVWREHGISCEKYAGCGGAPNALAEVETVHYYPSLPRSIGKSLWHFQPIDPWKYRLVAALAATPVVFLDPYVACPIFAKKLSITLFRTADVCKGNEEIPTTVCTTNAQRKGSIIQRRLCSRS